jgi:hypothetical protein
MIKACRMRWLGHVAWMADKVFRGKPELRRPRGRPRHRWEYNTKMDLREIEWGVMSLIDLAEDRNQWLTLVDMVINLQVP